MTEALPRHRMCPDSEYEIMLDITSLYFCQYYLTYF